MVAINEERTIDKQPLKEIVLQPSAIALLGFHNSRYARKAWRFYHAMQHLDVYSIEDMPNDFAERVTSIVDDDDNAHLISEHLRRIGSPSDFVLKMLGNYTAGNPPLIGIEPLRIYADMAGFLTYVYGSIGLEFYDAALMWMAATLSRTLVFGDEKLTETFTTVKDTFGKVLEESGLPMLGLDLLWIGDYNG